MRTGLAAAASLLLAALTCPTTGNAAPTPAAAAAVSNPEQPVADAFLPDQVVVPPTDRQWDVPVWNRWSKLVQAYKHTDAVISYDGVWDETPRWHKTYVGANSPPARLGFEFVGLEFILLGHVPPGFGQGSNDATIVHVETDGRSERFELLPSPNGWDDESGGGNFQERFLIAMDDYSYKDGEGIAFDPHRVIITVERGALAVFSVVTLSGTALESAVEYVPNWELGPEFVDEAVTEDGVRTWDNITVPFEDAEPRYTPILKPLVSFARKRGTFRTGSKIERKMEVYRDRPRKPTHGIVATHPSTFKFYPPRGATYVNIIGVTRTDMHDAKDKSYSVEVSPVLNGYERTQLDYTLSAALLVRANLFSWPLDPMREQAVTLEAGEGVVLLGVEYFIAKEIPEVTEEEQAVPNPGIVVTSDPTHDWLYNGMMVLLVLSLVCFGTAFVIRIRRALQPRSRASAHTAAGVELAATRTSLLEKNSRTGLAPP